MGRKINRRTLLHGALLSGAAAGVGMASRKFPGAISNIYDLTDALNYGLHDLLLTDQPLVREFDPTTVARLFPTSGTTSPRDKRYQDFRKNGFTDWTLKVDGLVDRPLNLSLAELHAMQPQTQVTLHTCDEGWSAIGQWTGVTVASLLASAGVKPGAKYLVFHCMDTMSDGNLYYESIDLFAASHPQTILAYGLNGDALPESNGAPLRLRVETQIGYKHAKYVERVEVVDSLTAFGAGQGGWWEDADGAVWYAGL